MLFRQYHKKQKSVFYVWLYVLIYLIQVDTGAPIWCRTFSQSRILAGLAFVEGSCTGTGISGIRIAFYEQWIRQILDAVDCGYPYTINDGTIVLDVQGKSTFSAKASVTCNEGYEPSLKQISCGQDGQWSSARCDMSVYNDCRDLRNRGITTSGIYTVQLWKTGLKIQVYCDMETDGGGWTVFQNRFNGSVDFHQNLAEYENGFGDLGGEFWTGLRYVQEMAQLGTTELRFDVSTEDHTAFYSVFQNFHLGSDNRYELHIGARSGSVHSSVPLNYANGVCFSTRDRDCDGMDYMDVSSVLLGGWWFTGSNFVLLNGLYATPGIVHAISTPYGEIYRGIFHRGFSWTVALRSSKMMFRRVQL